MINPKDPGNETQNHLFAEMNETPPKKDLIIKEELNIAEHPIAVLKRPASGVYEIKLSDTHTWTLIGNPVLGGLPELHELDYYYALVELLWEQTRYESATIFFTIHELIKKAEKLKCKAEYRRAMEALERFRHLVIRSSKYVMADGDTVKTATDDVSIFSYFGLVSNKLIIGRKKRPQECMDGYAVMTFADLYLNNLRSSAVSKDLNYTMRMGLSTPLCRRYFSLIDCWRYKASNGQSALEVEKSVFQIAKLLTLSSKYKYPTQITRTLDIMNKELIEKNYVVNATYRKEKTDTFLKLAFSEYNTLQAAALNALRVKFVSPARAAQFVREKDPKYIMDVITYCEVKGKADAAYLVRTLEKADPLSIEAFLSAMQKKEKEDLQKNIAEKQNKIRRYYEQEMESLIDSAISQLTLKEKESIIKKASASGVNHKFGLVNSKVAHEVAIREAVKITLQMPDFETWLKANDHKILN